MATDRDEQQREQERQQQELEEIRRSFAEMGARMGSLFEPAETDKPGENDEPGRPQWATLPAPPSPAAKAAPVPTQAPAILQGRPRWWWVVGPVLLFLAGTAVGWVLPGGGDGSDMASPPQPTTVTTVAPTTTPTTAAPRVSVPEPCVDTAELADEVISRLTRNVRDNRLALMIRDYTIASQACRKEASP